MMVSRETMPKLPLSLRLRNYCNSARYNPLRGLRVRSSMHSISDIGPCWPHQISHQIPCLGHVLLNPTLKPELKHPLPQLHPLLFGNPTLLRTRRGSMWAFWVCQDSPNRSSIQQHLVGSLKGGVISSILVRSSGRFGIAPIFTSSTAQGGGRSFRIGNL